jgi:hypothetical protein
MCGIIEICKSRPLEDGVDMYRNREDFRRRRLRGIFRFLGL